MNTTLGHETGIAGVLQDFIRAQIEAIGACRIAIPRLAGPDERLLVVGLRGAHERQLHHLRQIAVDVGLDPPQDGTAYEASTLGGLRGTAMRGNDRLLLGALAREEATVIDGYRRVLRNTALTALMRPLFERALTELRRHHRDLVLSARLAL